MSLSGANLGWDNRREHGDPEAGQRVDRLIEQTKSGVRAEGVEEILIPGESELKARERSLRDGVPLRPSTCNALRKYVRKAGLKTSWWWPSRPAPTIEHAQARSRVCDCGEALNT